jgi:hypothetical protein
MSKNTNNSSKKSSILTKIFSINKKKQPSLNYTEMVSMFEEKIKKDL